MNHRLAIGVVVGFIAANCSSAPAEPKRRSPRERATSPPRSASELKTLKDKAAYAIGVNSGASIRRVNEGQTLGLDAATILRGFRDALAGGKLQLSDEAMDEALQKLQDDVAERNAAAGEAYLMANKSKSGVKTLPSGLQVKVLRKGTGKKPKISDLVVVHYRGKTVEGKEFESSYETNQPVTLGVGQVIAGWAEALQLMEVGAKWEVVIPPDLAYGQEPREKFGPNSTLVFELELVDIVKPNPGLPGVGPLGTQKPGKPVGKPEEIEN